MTENDIITLAENVPQEELEAMEHGAVARILNALVIGALSADVPTSEAIGQAFIIGYALGKNA